MARPERRAWKEEGSPGHKIGHGGRERQAPARDIVGDGRIDPRHRVCGSRPQSSQTIVIPFVKLNAELVQKLKTEAKVIA